ncbi:MAG: hypothetical protein D6719_07245 [Candidatus Dadabacteria bacterium]|nr:MAG: hypothetical protein D6719_07245 [Candidatus Dadabacteria bacterium]
MEVVVGAPETGVFNPALTPNTPKSKDEIIANQLLKSDRKQEDGTVVSFEQIYSSLPITAQKIIDRLNEMLKGELPDGIQSLKPEDVTPEATADRIVTGITSLFDAYAKQNPNMSDQELINSFMDKAYQGVDRGYGEAYKTLDGLGAFEFDGVEEGIDKTLSLVKDKLSAFETQKKQELGLLPVEDENIEDVSSPIKHEFLAQGGAHINVTA